jgi:hypothetical protein
MFKKSLFLSLLLFASLNAQDIDIRGEWYHGIQDYGQVLEISNVNDKSFDFNLDSTWVGNVESGNVNVGNIEGKATYNEDKTATFKDEENCKIDFDLNDAKLKLEVTDECSSYGGLNTYFGGDFDKYKTNFYPQDIKKLKEEILAIKTKDELFKYLQDRDMMSLYNNEDEGYYEEESQPEAINSIAVDIFKKNLFGSKEKEYTLQVRADIGSADSGTYSFYAISFFTKDGYKVAGNITVNQEKSDYVPFIDDTKDKYFVFDYKELKEKDEFAVLGNIYGGYCGGMDRGDRFSKAAWQITRDGVNELFYISTYKYSYSSPSPDPIELERKEISFVKADKDAYPKKLKIQEYVFGTYEASEDEGSGIHLDENNITAKNVSYKVLEFK